MVREKVLMNRIKNSKEDLLFNIITYTILALFALAIIYPLYFVVIASFSNAYDVLNGNVYFLPKNIDFSGYKRIIEDTSIWTGYANTILYTTVGTAINVSLTMMIGYPLSRSYFSGRKVITAILLITMYFQGGLIPQYLLVSSLGLRGTRMVMVLLGAVSVYNVIVARSFLQANITQELEDAASIDGCAPIQFFISMVVPLSKSIIAVLIMYYGIAHWNDYFRGMIYLNKTEQFPLQLVLRSILIQSQSLAGSDNVDLAVESQRMAEQMKYGVIIVSSLPVLMLYPFLMKYFEKGVMIGSVKG